MTIKAILRDGRIQPIEPLPPDWAEGQSLTVVNPVDAPDKATLEEWAREMQSGIQEIPNEEHDHFRDVIAELERESKESVRREWGLS